MSDKYPEKALAWTDVETTGTNEETDLLLEVAVLVTDVHLNLLDDEGYQAVIYYDRETAAAARERAVPFVQNMHDETGLWDKVSDLAVAKPLEQVDAEVLAYLQRYIPDAKTARLAGNSVRLDLNFVEKYLPQTYAWFTYRMGDMSSVAGVVQWWLDEGFYPKKKRHAAMDDIRESLDEARWLRRRIREGAIKRETPVRDWFAERLRWLRRRIREGAIKRETPVRDWFAERLLTDVALGVLLDAGQPTVEEDALTWQTRTVSGADLPEVFTGGRERVQLTVAVQGTAYRGGTILVFVESHLFAYGAPANDWLWSAVVSNSINPYTLAQNGLTVLSVPPGS